MGPDDDIAASLPRPPHPTPARREAALAEALRRYDGRAEERPVESARPGRANSSAPWWARINRPQSGALAGALLVALIALPLAWTSLPDQLGNEPARSAGEPTSPGPDAARRNPSPPASADAVPMPPAGDEGTALDSAAVDPGSREAARAAIDPPAAPAVRVDQSPTGAAEEADFVGDGSREITVTGSRIRRPNLESTVPVTSVGGEELRPREARTRRGGWNACTVEDPKRDLKTCRRDVATVARGASGKAGAHLGDGLERAWNGDLEAAIAEFDRAVALAPRSSAAHLNRGLAWRSRGDLDRALADLDRAVRFGPQSARAYYHRSVILRERGDVRRARADEARAVELDPDFARVVGARR
ncbi:MAG TPA: tetratricopeptide repeat protein [Allosphingosinicella sp.]|jgi:hypothetical protein